LRFSGIGRVCDLRIVRYAFGQLDSDVQREVGVTRFEYNGKLYTVYHLAGDRFCTSDGKCTHEQTELSGGLVIDVLSV
jgi:hypothetical protein